MSFLWLSVNKCIPLRNFILERQQIMLVEGRKSHLIWYLLNGCKLKGGSWNSCSPVACQKWFWNFKSTTEKKHSRVIIYSGAPLRSATNFKNVRPPYQCRCSVRLTFNTGTFRHLDFLGRGIYGTRIFRHRNISARGDFGMWKFWHSSTCAEMSVPKHSYYFARCRNIHVPKYAGAKISRAEMSMVLNIPCAENSPCWKFPMSKRSRVETSICWNVRMAEWCSCRNVPVMKHPCRKASCQNLSCRNGGKLETINIRNTGVRIKNRVMDSFIQ